METHNLLILSTSHVTAATAMRLTDGPVSDWPVSGAPYGPYGWFCYAHDEDVEGNIPVEMMNVFRFARVNGCGYVLFDRDADVIDELPTWDW